MFKVTKIEDDTITLKHLFDRDPGIPGGTWYGSVYSLAVDRTRFLNVKEIEVGSKIVRDGNYYRKNTRWLKRLLKKVFVRTQD